MYTFSKHLNIKNQLPNNFSVNISLETEIKWDSFKGATDIESESEVAQLCPTPHSPMNCSLPSSSVHGIFQARVLEWGAIAFFRGSSQLRDWTKVSRIVDRHFTVWATREVCHRH